jgi:hypothetical protein
MGEGDGFPRVQAVVSFVSPGLPVAYHNTKGALECDLTNLLVGDTPPSSLLDPKRVQLCQRAKVVETWCRSHLSTLKGGEKGMLKAPGLD